MISMSSTLANYTDLKEVSATLDKLKENALKKIRSIHDIGDHEYKRNLNKNIVYAMDSNTYNNYMINQKATELKEDVVFNDCDHQNEDTYDLFKNDASNKSKDLNDVFEYDFVNINECFYNEYQQLHEGPYAKQYGRSCSNQFENLQEDDHQESPVQHNSHDLSAKTTNDLNEMDDIYAHEDFRNSNEQLFEFMHSEQLDSDVKWNSRNLGNIQEDENHHMPNDPQNYSHSKKLFEQANCEDEETLSPTNDVANQDKADDFKYGPSLYSCNFIQNTGSVGNYSNDSTDRESCNSEMNREPMQDNNISLQNSYGHMDDDMKNFGANDENSVQTKSEKMQASLDNDTLSTDEAQKIDYDKSIGNNCEINSNVDIQKMNKILQNSVVRQSNNNHYERRNKKIVEDGKRIGLYDEYSNQACSNLKGNEYNYRQHGDRERSNFKSINMYTRAYNKVNNRFVRRRFEDFKGRRRINDRDMLSHTRECGFQDFRKYAYNSTAPRQHMFLRKPNFNEDRHNMSHERYNNGLHNLRDSRKINRFSHGTNSFHNAKVRENFKNVSQQSSPSVYKEVPHIHYSRKRSRRSVSPESDEDDKPSYKDNHVSDTEKSPIQGFSDCRYRRFGAGTSGLGGYSPRRRRSETAIKTPSPPPRSPDRRKTRAWDMVPEGIDTKVVAAIAAAHTAQQAVTKQVSTLSSISPLVSMNIVNPTNNPNVASNPTFSSILPSILHQVNPPLTTVTLTQATRSIRRLYVGNVPSTVSDGELMEFMNAAMLSANANYIPGTKPCINCIVNIEKAYAFAEFITPEDATTALGFDGVTLHGTILKIRRPKDFIAPEHGGCPIAQPMINLVANVVLDSPQKIFVGGISSLLTPDKVKEIVTAFGQLKSFHWKTMDLKGSCMAFLEYLDPVVTHQACVGLNGMHLGGQVLTVLQATPDAKYAVFSSNPPFYDVPKVALPLLETPTNIIKLYNLISEEEVCNMEDDEVKELMEDVRFECKRFGNIRSMQLVKPPTLPITAISTVCNNTKSEKVPHLVKSNNKFSNDENKNNVSSLEIINQIYGLKDNVAISPIIEGEETHNIKDSNEDQVINNNAFISLEHHSKHDCKEEKVSLEVDFEDGCKDEKVSLEVDCEDGCKEEKVSPEVDCEDGCKEEKVSPEVDCEDGCNEEKLSSEVDCGHSCKEETVSSEDDCGHIYKDEKVSLEVDCGHGCKEEKQLIEECVQPMSTLNSSIPNTNNLCDSTSNLIEFEALKMGHIYVEYSREESACQAAHALQGRTFGQRKVEVAYISPRLYFKYFGKGLGIQTLEEKQTLSLAVQKHLTTHIKD